MESILEPEFQRIDPHLLSDDVQLIFHSKPNLGNPVSSHCSSDRFVRIDMAAFKEEIFEAVGEHDEITGKGDHQRGGAVIGASISDGPELLGVNRPVFLHSCLEMDMKRVSLSRGGEDLFAVINKLNRFLCPHREESGTEVLRIEVDLLAKSASHFRFDDPDAALGEIEV